MNRYFQDLDHCTEQAGIPWEKLIGKTLLITGASGLIGSALVDLVARGCPQCHIIAGGRNLPRMRKRFAHIDGHKNFTIWAQDLSGDFHLPTDDINYIIHAAGMSAPALYASHPVEVINTNYYSLSRLIDIARKKMPSCRLLYVSSDEVYGQCSTAIIDENHSGYVNCFSPRSCYPSSKRLCESLVAAACSEYSLDAVIARPSHVYGPFYNEGDNRVYAQFFRNAVSGTDIIMKSQGEQMRSWCYSVDCASALLLILLSGQRAMAYNVADNSAVFTIRDLAQMVALASGAKLVMQLAPEEERRGYNPVKKSVLATERLSSLGWKALEGTPEQKIMTCILTQKEYETTQSC